MHDLMNQKQVIELLTSIFGVTPRVVAEQWLKRDDFPKPSVVISRSSKAWRRADVEAFLGVEVERG